MKAIDTNVLVRIFVNDDKKQAKLAKEYVIKNGVVFISNFVVCEFTWVLRKGYQFDFESVQNAIELILRSKEFIVEDAKLLWEALNLFSKSSVEFADLLIGLIAKNNGVEMVGTFDK